MEGGTTRNAIAHTELTHPPKMFGFSDFVLDTPGVDLCPLRSVSKARLKSMERSEKKLLYVNASECTHISHFRVLRNESIPFYHKNVFFSLLFVFLVLLRFISPKNCLNSKFFPSVFVCINRIPSVLAFFEYSFPETRATGERDGART